MPGAWTIYTGMTVAPWSPSIFADGWRLRVQSGYGHYASGSGSAGRSRETGTSLYADALAGYQWQVGTLIAKLFGGIAGIEQTRARPSRTTTNQEWGPKGALELWFDITRSQWTSMNLSATTARQSVSASWRYGITPVDGFSLGPELRFDSNGYTLDDYSGRAGVFASRKWDAFEIAASGGFAARVSGWSASRSEPYVNVNFLIHY